MVQEHEIPTPAVVVCQLEQGGYQWDWYGEDHGQFVRNQDGARQGGLSVLMVQNEILSPCSWTNMTSYFTELYHK